MRRIDPDERRARLGRRHALAAEARAGDPAAAARAVVCLHGTDPASVYLSVRARADGVAPGDIDRALYEERSLVKHMAMRRTLWVVPHEYLAAVQAAGSVRVAAAERRRLIKEIEAAGIRRDGRRWLTEARRAVLGLLEDGSELTSAEIRERAAPVRGTIAVGTGRWASEVPLAPRVLTILAAEGRVVRAGNDGGWWVSRPRWARTPEWLGEGIDAPDERRGSAELVELWLRAFGPATEADIKWWLGSTLTAARRALADLEAVEVEVEQGATAYLLPDDLEPVAPPQPWAALLPALDPTTMGWLERDWYLGAHRELLFDRNGNAGATAWWCGRVVGGWRQDDAGTVELQLLEDIGAEGRAALEREAHALSAWLDGRRVMARFPSPLSRQP